MTPKELLQLQPEETSQDVSILVGCYYNHIIESGINHLPPWIKQDRVQLRYYRNYYFDSRRCWILASVWFDEKPVMIVQNAGREGDDHAKRFILDYDIFVKMLGYLSMIYSPPDMERPVKDMVEMDQDLPLTSFYGCSLSSLEDFL